MNSNNNLIAETWIRYHKKKHPKDNDQDFEATELLTNLVAEDPLRAMRILDMVITKTDELSMLAMVGAGPLEDLLKSDAGTEYVDQVIDNAQKDKNWRIAFGCVWTSSIADRKLADKIEQTLDIFFPNGRP